MKHYKLVDFLSNLNVKPPLHERRDPDGSGQAVAPGITKPICIPLVITTTLSKIFELLWFDKLHVEMDLV